MGAFRHHACVLNDAEADGAGDEVVHVLESHAHRLSILQRPRIALAVVQGEALCGFYTAVRFLLFGLILPGF